MGKRTVLFARLETRFYLQPPLTVITFTFRQRHFQKRLISLKNDNPERGCDTFGVSVHEFRNWEFRYEPSAYFAFIALDTNYFHPIRNTDHCATSRKIAGSIPD